MPVYKILDEMPYEEFIGWNQFFASRPVGWREDYRTSLLLNAQGVKKKGSEIFESLKTLERKSKSAITPGFLKLLKEANGAQDWNPTIE
jgi:hypothetical protein